MNMIKCAGGVLALFTVPGLIFCMVTRKFWYNPINIAEGSAVGYFYLVFIFLPIVIGVFLNSYRVQNYRLIDYIKLYLQPKKPINQHGRHVKLTGYQINSFVEKL